MAVSERAGRILDHTRAAIAFAQTRSDYHIAARFSNDKAWGVHTSPDRPGEIRVTCTDTAVLEEVQSELHKRNYTSTPCPGREGTITIRCA